MWKYNPQVFTTVEQASLIEAKSLIEVNLPLLSRFPILPQIRASVHRRGAESSCFRTDKHSTSNSISKKLDGGSD